MHKQNHGDVPSSELRSRGTEEIKYFPTEIFQSRG